jgi:1-deoxy-D-xylulose-5-phosphate reductoisomerase
MKRIAILGSTGSIGTQTLEVIADHPDIFEVVGLSAHRNLDLLSGQIRRFHPKIVAAEGSTTGMELAEGIECAAPGLEGLAQVATHPDVDTVVVATVGAAGLVPTLAALRAGKTIALANKEVLVMGGEILMAEARRLNKPIVPIDSEHSAILQCLQGENLDNIRKIVITASGGPFREWSLERIKNATKEQALNHPTWSMGKKITIDSATLVNKGLEVIEAHHLFGLPMQRIEVVIHPQSIIHSMVEFTDGSVMAQMGWPDMRIPIQFALSYPDRLPRMEPSLNLAAVRTMTFEEPDLERFPCLGMAFESCRKGGGYPTVFSVANEEAVAAFLEGALEFGRIAETIDRELQLFEDQGQLTFERILEIETQTRENVRTGLRGVASTRPKERV